MKNITAPTVNKGEIFLYLYLLTGFFLLLEISFFIQTNQAYLDDFNYVSSQLIIPRTIFPGILFFCAVQLLVHIIWTFFVGCISISLYTNRLFNKQSPITLAVIIWLLSAIIILLANQYLFPNSKFADLTALLFRYKQIAAICLFIMVSLFLCLVGIAFWMASSKIKLLWVCSFLTCGLIYHLNFFYSGKQFIKTSISTQPNIFIIGIDSLRPDYLSFFGHKANTSFLDSLLNQSVVFSEAVTPLARTFPAWVSIFSGLYPRDTGVRSDLSRQSNLDYHLMLPKILKAQGYETIYATDESRFSNIDERFGFDKVFSPPMGLNDFLLGTLNDFPLTNLLINTQIGKWLFPYSYANRAAAFVYQPNSFLNLIRPELMQIRKKPLFFAIHFCLPHFPYIWASRKIHQNKIRADYQASILEMDKQLRAFFSILKKNNLLDHAIVVLLSDHGEALELSGDRITEKDLFITSQGRSMPHFYPPSLEDEQVNQSAGHGTDVLGLSQYHVLLSIKQYGRFQQSRIIPGLVSLTDIKPTILALLGLSPGKSIHKYEGQSLASAITHAIPQTNRKRPQFLESDFSPAAIRTIYPKIRKVMLEGVHLFQIDQETTRLTLKQEMEKMIIRSKQFAIIDGDWMLARYPQQTTIPIEILINLRTGQWTDELPSTFTKQSSYKELHQQLESFLN